MPDKAGISAAIQAVGAGAAPEAGDAACQLSLLGPAGGEVADAEPVAAGERRAGRPRGARNRRTAEMVRYLTEARGLKTPLEFLVEMFNEAPAEVARRMGLFGAEGGLATAEAAKMQVQAAIAALPYMHAKQPVALQAVGKTAGMLILPGDDGAEAEAADDLGFDLVQDADGKWQAIQWVDDEAASKSDDDKSEGGGK